jgi:hypothetical protein
LFSAGDPCPLSLAIVKKKMTKSTLAVEMEGRRLNWFNYSTLIKHKSFLWIWISLAILSQSGLNGVEGSVKGMLLTYDLRR